MTTATRYVAINKKKNVALGDNMQMFGIPEEGFQDYSFLWFFDKAEAERAASQIISPKFVVVEIEVELPAR